jgi:hypothetical protein
MFELSRICCWRDQWTPRGSPRNDDQAVIEAIGNKIGELIEADVRGASTTVR